MLLLMLLLLPWAKVGQATVGQSERGWMLLGRGLATSRRAGSSLFFSLLGYTRNLSMLRLYR